MSRDPKVHKGRAQRALTLPPAWEEEAAAVTTARPYSAELVYTAASKNVDLRWR